MESLVTPQSEKWHGLAVTDPLAPEASDEEMEYFERYRDYMFAVRYNSRSGFIGAHQKALRSAIALGAGIVFVEECLGREAQATPTLYRYLPLSECYLAVDAQEVVPQDFFFAPAEVIINWQLPIAFFFSSQFVLG